MIVVRSSNYMRSRNTLIIFALLFFTFVISFKFIIGFAVDNIIIFTGTIVDSGYIDPSKFELSSYDLSMFEIDWSLFDLSKLNPLLWKFEELKGSINGSLHDLVDVIAPALINTASVVSAQIVTARVIFYNNPNMIVPLMLYDSRFIIII